MKEKYDEYLKYDFNNSAEYKDFNDKFPKELNESLDDYKKRFYKSYICHDFDINYSPPLESNNNIHNNNNSYRNRRNNQINTNPSTLEIIDLGIIGLSILCLPFSYQDYSFLLMTYFIYRVLISTGVPRFNLDYLKVIIHNNNFNLFIFSFMLWITRTKNIFVFCPVLIHTALYFTKSINKYIRNNYLDPIVNLSTKIKDFYQYFEIFNLFSTIIGIFFGLNKFYFIFIYLQYIKFRYYASSDIREKINNIRVKLEYIRTNPNIPTIFRNLAEIAQKIGTAFANGFAGGNFVMVNGAFIGCNIF